MEGCRGISFVDDITWKAEGEGLLDLVMKMEEYAERGEEPAVDRWESGTFRNEQDRSHLLH